MNKITDKQINKILEKQMDYIKTLYDEKQCLGLFTYGRANYGFAETEDDIQTVLCYIPTFEELCCKTEPIDIKYIEYENKQIRICDVRLLYMLATKQEQIILEAVFSDYKILNSRYKKIFDKYIYMNKEAIFHCNQRLRIENSCQTGLQLIDRYEQNNDVNDIFEACRLRISCELYISGVSVENCINLKKDYHIDYLQQVKNGNIIPNLRELRNSFNNMLLESQDFKENDNCKDLIKNSVIELMKVALTDMMQLVDFNTLLTKTEKNALDIIINELENGYDGNISISNLIENSSISRPVFKNLLQKMKDNKIAEIDNQGVKGTYIKIIDGNLLKQIDKK